MMTATLDAEIETQNNNTALEVRRFSAADKRI